MTKESLLNARGLMTLFLLAWALYIFYPFKLSEGGMSADGVTYVHIAKNIVLDGSPGWQATWAAPFFSVLMAAVYPVFGSFAVAGMVVSKIMTILLPLAVYLLAYALFNSRVGVIAAVLTAFHPHFTFISGSLEPEVTYTTLQVFSLWAIWRALNSSEFKVQSSELNENPESKTQNSELKTRNFLWAILGGILASLAYQTRSEGLLIFVFVMAALVIIALVQRLRLTSYISRIIIILAIVISFILTSLPYLMFLKQTYGKWVLSPKSTYVQIWMKSRIYRDNDLGEQGNPELWGLSKKGKLMWQEPKGLSDLAGYLMSHPQKSWQVYVDNFKRQMPWSIPNNSSQWLYPRVYPWYFVIPAFFWIGISLKRREDLKRSIFLLSPFLILFILPIFTDGWWKYLLPYSPFLIVLAVAGISSICERFQWRHLLPTLTIIIVGYSLWTVKASPLVKHGDRSVTARGEMAAEQKKAGEWAQNRFKGTPNYMIQWSKLAYYLNGRWTAMPVTNYNGMIWYARKNKVDYIVFETFSRFEKEEVLTEMRNIPDVEAAGVYESQDSLHSYNAVFLRLKW